MSRAVICAASLVFLADHTHLSRSMARRRLPRSGSSRNMRPVPSPRPAPNVNPLFIAIVLLNLDDAQIWFQQTRDRVHTLLSVWNRLGALSGVCAKGTRTRRFVLFSCKVSNQEGNDQMPEKETLERARQDKREGKAASTQAGKFVREEIEHIREGKHGARSTKQAIAIGLSKARRAGVKLPAKKGTSKKVQEQAARDIRKGKSSSKGKKSTKRSRAALRVLKREGHNAASKKALSRQARSAAAKRSAASRSRAAKKAAATRKK